MVGKFPDFKCNAEQATGLYRRSFDHGSYAVEYALLSLAWPFNVEASAWCPDDGSCFSRRVQVLHQCIEVSVHAIIHVFSYGLGQVLMIQVRGPSEFLTPE